MFAARSAFTIFFAALLQSSCGAPTKSAHEVAPSLVKAQSLQERLDAICGNVMKDEQFSGSLGPRLDLDCQEAGIHAIDYAKSSAFYIRGFDDVKDGSEAGIEYVHLRTQLWFEQTLLRIAGQILEQLRTSIDGAEAASTIDTLTQGTVLEQIKIETDLLTLEAKLVGKPRIELNPVRITQDIDVNVVGIVPVSLKLNLLVTLKEHGFALVINGQSASTDSFINDFDAAILVVPFANQTYVDSQVRLGLRSGGWGQAGAKAIDQLIDASFKNVVDEFLGFEAAR